MTCEELLEIDQAEQRLNSWSLSGKLSLFDVALWREVIRQIKQKNYAILYDWELRSLADDKPFDLHNSFPFETDRQNIEYLKKTNGIMVFLDGKPSPFKVKFDQAFRSKIMMILSQKKGQVNG